VVRYRPEIDGLRAVAVIPVILYHAHLKAFSGGFVGVDVFFVISGYLISSIILAELDVGRFSIASFYERRIRRIFPLLFVVLAASLAAGYLILLPHELSSLSSSMFKATLFWSNIGFFREAGYFDAAAESKPLLHTWSLSVEEQFYLWFPPLVAVVFRWRRKAVPYVVAAMIAGSFAWSMLALKREPFGAFFLPHYRAWELLLGVLVGFAPALSGRAALRGALSLLGLACIAYAVLRFSEATPFPGKAALLPTLGAALFIWAESTGLTWIGRALASAPFVAVGLLSYALYLWHWPVLVFAHLYTVRPLTPSEVSGALILTGLLALASRYCIEEPVRRRRVLPTRKGVFVLAGTCMLAFCVVTESTVVADGFPSRLSKPTQDIVAFTKPRGLEVCIKPPKAERRPSWANCDVGIKNEVVPNIFVWGDSHAQAWAPVVRKAARQLHTRATIGATASCAPLLGVGRIRGPFDFTGKCTRFNAGVAKFLSAHEEYKTVVLIGRWGLASGRTFADPEAPLQTLVEKGERAPKKPFRNPIVLRRGFERTLDFLTQKGRRVVLVASVPDIGYRVTDSFARLLWLGRQVDMRPTRSDYLQWQDTVLHAIAQVRESRDFKVVYPHEFLCGKDHCEVLYEGKPIYRDDNHVTTVAAELLARPLADAIQSSDAEHTSAAHL
jgi:peptidoglycan/LPS O-acetylase OafA/YrhL